MAAYENGSNGVFKSEQKKHKQTNTIKISFPCDEQWYEVYILNLKDLEANEISFQGSTIGSLKTKLKYNSWNLVKVSAAAYGSCPFTEMSM